MDSYKSRSQKKRESTALQQLGVRLLALPERTLADLGLPASLCDALTEYKSLKTHEAKRRHMQYIGRLMRELDEPEAIIVALEAAQSEQRRDAQRFHGLEDLRNRLLHPQEIYREEALAEALASYPSLEKAQLVHVQQAALAEREKRKPPKFFRELFRLLRDAAQKQEQERAQS